MDCGGPWELGFQGMVAIERRPGESAAEVTALNALGNVQGFDQVIQDR